LNRKQEWSQRLGVFLAAAVTSGVLFNPPAGAQANPDFEATRQEITRFESLMDDLISRSFSNPFALVQKTKGVYLQGYGITFNFLVNIHRAVVDTPFGKARTGKDISEEEKRIRIEDLKDKVVRLLAENGMEFRQVRADQSVTVVGFFVDRNFLDEKNQNKTLVLRAFKKDLQGLAGDGARWKELKQRMEIVEY